MPRSDLRYAIVLLLICSAPATAITNLLTNGDFETGSLTGWGSLLNAEVSNGQMHGGSYSCHQLSGGTGRMNQARTVTPGKVYKALAWFYIVQSSNVQWGGIRLAAFSGSWTTLAQTTMTAGTHGAGAWFKAAIRFTATDGTVNLTVDKWVNSDAVVEFYVDDISLFEDDGTNPPPEIQIAITPNVATSVPAAVQYSLTGDDPNGAITNIYWSFGEGGHALDAAGQYVYTSPGIYSVQAVARDDQGAQTVQTVTVTLSDPSFPAVNLSSPAGDPSEVSDSSILISGQAVGAATVRWSTDRDEAGAFPDPATLNTTVPLHPGRNRISINAFSATGQMTRLEREVHYHPAALVQISSPSPQATSVECWEPFTVTFDVQNSWATRLQWPYDPAPAPGVEPALGITVNGEFSDDGFATTLVQPAFYYQPYRYEVRNGKDWLTPQGQPCWMLRFAPPRPGAWQYRITVTDARGTVTSSAQSFTATTPANPLNHGFVRTNAVDRRYFSFDDGSHFLGLGHNETYVDVASFLTRLDTRLATIANDSANLFRIWMLGSCIWGSGHPPLLSATLPYHGYLPAEGLSSLQAYAQGDVSVKLDASNPCMFYGWLGGDTALQSGHSYRVRVRVKVIGATGPAQAGYPCGFTVKNTGWPNPPANFFPTKPAIVPHCNGSLDWSVQEGTFTANSSFLGNLSFILENTTAGTAWIDQISIREVLSGGQLGPELNRRPRTNYHTCFDDLTSWQYDYMLQRAMNLGLYYRIVVAEKDDWVLTRLGAGGFMEKNSSPTNFNAAPGTPGYSYQTYWWRYLTARWGAYRSVHSWELANEQDPNDSRGYRHTQRMAAWFHANDPVRHDALTSFWSDFPATGFWGNTAYPDVFHADVHAYLYYGTTENTDTAYAHWTLGRSLLAKNIGKPIIRGETGILGPDSHGGGEDADLKRDTTGVWLHNLTWAQLDYNGMQELYWYPDNIRGENVGHGDLYGVYRVFRGFMSDIPLGNGSYADARATSSNPVMRVVGQFDRTAGRGHLWIGHADHHWRNVVDGVPISPASATVEIPDLETPARYSVTWFDTYNGLATGQQNLLTSPAGALSLQVDGLTTDVAVKIELVRKLARADFDTDDDVDQEDFGHLQACVSGPGITQSLPECADTLLDADPDVDAADVAIFQRCLSGPNEPAEPDCAN